MSEDHEDNNSSRLNEVSRLASEANEYYSTGRFAEAGPLYHQALAIQEEVLGREHPALANTLFGLGSLYYVQERYVEAETAYSRALSLLTAGHSAESPELIDTLLWLGQSRFKSQEYDEAREPYQRAVAILEQQSDCERLADALMKLAHLHYFVGEYPESEPYYVRALELYEKAVGPEDIAVACGALQLARLYHFQPELDKDAQRSAPRIPTLPRASTIWRVPAFSRRSMMKPKNTTNAHLRFAKRFLVPFILMSQKA